MARVTAVDEDEGTVTASARVVERFGDELPAGAAVSADEHAAVELHDTGQLREELLHAGGAPQEVSEALAGDALADEPFGQALDLEPALAQRNRRREGRDRVEHARFAQEHAGLRARVANAHTRIDRFQRNVT